jgi:ParB-like chromosome segregation protein Spo0J
LKAVKIAKGFESMLVPLSSVQQHPDNPNNGDVDALIESIQINGFNTVITVDRATGYIIAGNHRWQAMHALGATHIPVVFTDMDASGALRYMVADNRTGQLAVMDNHALIDLLGKLRDSDLGLAGTGFDEESMLRLMEQMAAEENAPMGDGGGLGVAPSGIFQVVIEFESPDERDECFANMAERYDNVRSVSL